jgi:hypothetical protein
MIFFEAVIDRKSLPSTLSISKLENMLLPHCIPFIETG